MYIFDVDVEINICKISTVISLEFLRAEKAKEENCGNIQGMFGLKSVFPPNFLGLVVHLKKVNILNTHTNIYIKTNTLTQTHTHTHTTHTQTEKHQIQRQRQIHRQTQTQTAENQKKPAGKFLTVSLYKNNHLEHFFGLCGGDPSRDTRQSTDSTGNMIPNRVHRA